MCKIPFLMNLQYFPLLTLDLIKKKINKHVLRQGLTVYS